MTGWYSTKPLSHLWQLSRMYAFSWCVRRLSKLIRPWALVVIFLLGDRCTKNPRRSSGARISYQPSPAHMQDIIRYPVTSYTMEETITNSKNSGDELRHLETINDYKRRWWRGEGAISNGQWIILPIPGDKVSGLERVELRATYVGTLENVPC